MQEDIQLIKISNEECSKLPPLTFKGKIVVVDKEELIEAACADIAKYKVIGFDTETRPSFKAGVSYKVALLQLSTPKTSYLFRLNKVGFKPQMISLLERRDIIKLGADVAGDLRALRALRNFKEGGFIDLQQIIEEWGIGEKSLRKMSAVVLGHRISKAQRLSNWEATNFTEQQKNYAATDAWACIEIYNKLMKMQKAIR